MKILIAAVSCHPRRGSENHVGWVAIRELSAHHELHVLAHGQCREGVEDYLREDPEMAAKVRFHFVRPPFKWHSNRFLARFQDWREYQLWARQSWRLAAELQAREKFDLAHHVTYATWRVFSPVSGLGIPFVFGPVGGGEIFPRAFLSILSPKAQAFELLRMASNTLAMRNRRLRASLEGAAWCLANNHETRTMLLKAGAHPGRISLLSQTFLSEAHFARFPGTASKPTLSVKLRIFAGGNLEGRKGVAIALDSMVRLRKRNIPFLFQYGGFGPELEHLIRKKRDYGLSDEEVVLGRHFEGAEYQQALESSHVYLLPSLREGAPVTMVEGMLAHCVPVVAACGGAMMLVDDSNGVPVAVSSPDKMAEEIADALEQLYRDPDQLATKGKAARESVLSACSKKAYLDGVADVYRKVMKFHT